MRIFRKGKKELKGRSFTNKAVEKAKMTNGETTGELKGEPGLIFKPGKE